MKKLISLTILCCLMLSCHHLTQHSCEDIRLSRINVIFPDSLDYGIINYNYDSNGTLRTIEENFHSSLGEIGFLHTYTHQLVYHSGNLLYETITEKCGLVLDGKTFFGEDEAQKNNCNAITYGYVGNPYNGYNIGGDPYNGFHCQGCKSIDITYNHEHDNSTNIIYLYDWLSRISGKLIHRWKPKPFSNTMPRPINDNDPNREEIFIKYETTFQDSIEIIKRYDCKNSKSFIFTSIDSVIWTTDKLGNEIKTLRHYHNKHYAGTHQWVYKNYRLVREMICGDLEDDEKYKYLYMNHPIENSVLGSRDTIYKEYIYEPLTFYYSIE